MAPQTYIQWTLKGQKGDQSLECGQAELPEKLGDHDVLVKIYAASLNYRDLVLAKVWYHLIIYCSLGSSVEH